MKSYRRRTTKKDHEGFRLTQCHIIGSLSSLEGPAIVSPDDPLAYGFSGLLSLAICPIYSLWVSLATWAVTRRGLPSWSFHFCCYVLQTPAPAFAEVGGHPTTRHLSQSKAPAGVTRRERRRRVENSKIPPQRRGGSVDRSRVQPFPAEGVEIKRAAMNLARKPLPLIRGLIVVWQGSWLSM